MSDVSHYIFTIMNHQRISTFQFCSPVLLEIHRNPNWNEFLKSCESFLRKSQFSKMRYLNPGFGGPWDMLGIFFVNVIFITLQKKSFGQKNFWIPDMGSKVPFCQNWKIAKMALLNPCKKFKIFFGQKTSFEALWKCHLQKIFITFSRVCQIQDLGQSKYKLRLFSKRTHGISKILFNLGSCVFLHPVRKWKWKA